MRKCWQARRRVGSRFDLLDEPLWQLHTVEAFLPPHLLEHSAVVVNGAASDGGGASDGGDSDVSFILLLSSFFLLLLLYL